MVDPAARKIAVIGLGLMGSALADALSSQGLDLVVWNRSSSKCERYADAGITVAQSAASAASEVDLLVVCLSDYQVSMDVLGADSVASSLAGKVLVLLSTMSADESLRTAEWAATHNIGYLDGSILGSPYDVRNQECRIVYSGPKTLFESCITELDAMGGKARHIGEKVGTALLFDKAVYSFYYAHCLGLCHGAAMCEAMGAPLDVYLESLTYDWERHDSKILEMIRKRDYTALEATMQVHAAAFSHVLPLSEKLGIDPSLPKVISDSFARAEKQGYKDSELPALFEILGTTNP
jgi:3-hydroxyisobutyrate dehydrogenase-like beta-hydroxyacid dehydrogenase